MSEDNWPSLDDAPARSELVRLASNFYRDEMRRTVAWRQRLDSTSNWAVVLTASILTFAFASTDNPHYILLVAILAILLFLLVEARRFRHYDIWRSRVRLLEENFFATAFSADSAGHGEWKEMLAADLESPRYRVSFLEAVQHRLRRLYLALLYMIGLSWVARITAFEPGPLEIQRDAAVGDVPGAWVAGGVAVLFLAATVFVILPLGGREHRETSGDGRTGDRWGDRED